MTLKHYDLFTAFTLVEAAHLAAGFDPQLQLHARRRFAWAAPEAPEALKVKVILKAMNHGINGAMCQASYALTLQKGERNIDSWVLIPDLLARELAASVPVDPLELKGLRVLLKDERRTGGLLFEREELARWFKAKGLGFKPEYDFAQLSNGDSPEPTNDTKPLSNRERDTLLTIIALTCREAKLDFNKPAKTANLLVNTAATMGISIGESTIEGHLKRITSALGGKTR
jgi:hypothetical protein